MASPPPPPPAATPPPPPPTILFVVTTELLMVPLLLLLLLLLLNPGKAISAFVASVVIFSVVASHIDNADCIKLASDSSSGSPPLPSCCDVTGIPMASAVLASGTREGARRITKAAVVPTSCTRKREEEVGGGGN